MHTVHMTAVLALQKILLIFYSNILNFLCLSGLLSSLGVVELRVVLSAIQDYGGQHVGWPLFLLYACTVTWLVVARVTHILMGTPEGAVSTHA